MSSTLRRIVVCDEPTRERDLRPGPPKAPSRRIEDIARRFGEALELPYIAVGISLEQCELTDFVFYFGFLNAFEVVTGDWPAERRRLRAHRTVDMKGYAESEYESLLERLRPALSIPRIDLGGPVGGAGTSAELYARRDIARAAGFRTFEVFRTEHYVAALSPPGMTQAEMVARYLRTYWDVLGY